MKNVIRRLSFIMALVVWFSVCFNSGITVEAAKTNKAPVVTTYKIYVNRAANCVTVYSKDAAGEYTVPVRAFACSTGKNVGDTPLGEFRTTDYYNWRLMVDGSYGQYAIRFNGHILFHSVPYLADNGAALESDQFNYLGDVASLGCVRLAAGDAKWIFDNCERGTQVVVYDDALNPGPLGKPVQMKIPENHPFACWDPTDPSENNPWNVIRPNIHLTNDMGDGVLYVPVGATMDDVKAAIGVTEWTGIEYLPTEFDVYLNGNYDLNTFGAYKVLVRTIDKTGMLAEKEMMLAVVYM